MADDKKPVEGEVIDYRQWMDKKTGQFVKGNPGAPPGTNKTRRINRVDKKLIRQLYERYPAPKVVDLLDAAVTAAEEGKNNKSGAILACATWLWDRMVGRPATRSLVVHADANERLEKWLRGEGFDDDEEDE